MNIITFQIQQIAEVLYLQNCIVQNYVDETIDIPAKRYHLTINNHQPEHDKQTDF